MNATSFAFDLLGEDPSFVEAQVANIKVVESPLEYGYSFVPRFVPRILHNIIVLCYCRLYSRTHSLLPFAIQPTKYRIPQ
jgi:hypothetical protein